MEVIARMTYDDLYDYEFERLLSAERDARLKAAHRATREDTSWHQLFDLGSSDVGWSVQRAYYGTVRRLAPIALGDLLILMLERRYGKEGQCVVRHLPGSLEGPSSLRRISPHFAVTEGGRTTGYVCDFRCRRDKDLAELGTYRRLREMASEARSSGLEGSFANSLLEADEAARATRLDEVVLLLIDDPERRDDNASGIDLQNRITTRRQPSLPLPVRYELLSDFFARHFGRNELKNLVSRARDLDADMRDEAGASTILIPTPKRMRDHKEECLRSVIAESSTYRKELISEGFLDDDVNHLYDSFFQGGLFAATVGGSAFADSFVSSEWLRSIHRLTDTLDQTGTVAGYLKSIEQLMYVMVKQWKRKGKGKRLPTHYDSKTFKYDSMDELDSLSDEDFEKRTAWQLACFFDPKAGNDALNICDDSASVLSRLLREFTSHDRNGYFHKHNLHCNYNDGNGRNTGRPNEVERIRHQAMLLHFALLGSCKISESCRVELRIEDWHGLIPDHPHGSSRLMHWVKASLSNPVVSFHLRRAQCTIAFRFGNVPKADDDIMVIVRGKGSYWRLEAELHEGPYEPRRLDCRRGIYSAPLLEWKEEVSYADEFDDVTASLRGLDWAALLPRDAVCPKLLLTDGRGNVVELYHRPM